MANLNNMTESEKQEFKEFIFQAVQSGKQETSNLVDSIIHKIEPAVEKSIEKYVNGKIRVMDGKLDAYIVSDNEWKALAQPVVDLGKNLQGFGKVALYTIGFVASVMGAILLFIEFFKNDK